MTTREPEWDSDTRSWALALQEHDNRRCSKCGLPVDVCQDPENEGRFEAEPPIRCFATTALAKFAQRYDDDPALSWTAPILRRRG